LSLHDNQITRHENIACVIVGPRQSSSRRDRRNGHPDCRCVPIQIVALQAALDHERSKAELKALVPEDAREASGHGVRAKRSKSGAISFDVLREEPGHAALQQ